MDFERDRRIRICERKPAVGILGGLGLERFGLASLARRADLGLARDRSNVERERRLAA
jgi:hypothetical protein